MMDRNALRQAVVRRLRIFAVLCCAGLLLPWLARGLARTELDSLWWVTDLAAHWQALYASALAASVLALVWLNRNVRWLALLPVLALPWLSASPTLPTANGTSDRTIKIIAANLHFGNDDPAKLRMLMDAEAADLVFLAEIGPGAAKALAVWPAWPHQARLPRADPFGLALVSKHPITGLKLEESPGGVPLLRATVDWQGTTLVVSVMHPMPPLSAAFARERDQVLANEAAQHAQHGRPALMAGDFNASPWSDAFSGPARAGFRRASSAFPGTWPAGIHWLGIPIDHVLASPHWVLAERRVGPDIGSDHRPVFTRLSWAEKPRQ
ncbi:MAG: endonuclease/exonuclease/phosphatase family protein [Burkholderiales bacterium]|nr:endonuclease/exonuclease/phosphatase family protein [Burkholderiales bacterium]